MQNRGYGRDRTPAHRAIRRPGVVLHKRGEKDLFKKTKALQRLYLFSNVLKKMKTTKFDMVSYIIALSATSQINCFVSD